MNTADLMTYLKTQTEKILKTTPLPETSWPISAWKPSLKCYHCPRPLKKWERKLAEFGLTAMVYYKFCIFWKIYPVEESTGRVSSLTILGGFNKLKEPENVELTIAAGK